MEVYGDNKGDTVWSVLRGASGDLPVGDAQQKESTPVSSPHRDKYSAVIAPLEDESLFSCIVLSMWDNVVGPRVRQVWLGDQNVSENFFERLLPFVAKCTLNGEISRETPASPDAKADQQFYVLNELGYAMSSFIFSSLVGPDATEPHIFSLSLILPIDKLQTYLELHQLCTDRMLSLLKKLQVLLRSQETEAALGVWLSFTFAHAVPASFTNALKPFVASVKLMGISCLDAGVNMSTTAFASDKATQFDLQFLRTAITSHLQTGGVSVVVGADAEAIDLMIDTLAVFLNPGERRMSRYATDQPYAPDLFIQGLVAEPTDEVSVLEPLEVVQSQRPSTLINVDKKTVRQTKQYNEFTLIHADAEREELDRLQGIAEPQRPEPQQQELFHDVPDKSEMVRELLTQVFTPHSSGVREALISQFNRSILRSAVVVIQAADTLGGSPEKPLKADVMKRMRKELGFSSDSDFRLVLASAEKLRRDTFLTVLGDPAVKQQQLVQLLHAF